MIYFNYISSKEREGFLIWSQGYLQSFEINGLLKFQGSDLKGCNWNFSEQV